MDAYRLVEMLGRFGVAGLSLGRWAEKEKDLDKSVCILEQKSPHTNTICSIIYPFNNYNSAIIIAGGKV